MFATCFNLQIPYYLIFLTFHDILAIHLVPNGEINLGLCIFIKSKSNISQNNKKLISSWIFVNKN